MNVTAFFTMDTSSKHTNKHKNQTAVCLHFIMTAFKQEALQLMRCKPLHYCICMDTHTFENPFYLFCIHIDKPAADWQRSRDNSFIFILSFFCSCEKSYISYRVFYSISWILTQEKDTHLDREICIFAGFTGLRAVGIRHQPKSVETDIKLKMFN